MLSFAKVTKILLDPSGEIEVIRGKDRINNPVPSGYRDFLLNVRVRGCTHVGELQLHLKPICDVKPMGHRTYTLLRSVG